MPHGAGKTAPNHDPVGVLHGLDGVFALVPADPLGLLTLHLEALMHLNVDSSEYMTLDQSAAVK
jgi:hypothetical protein